MSLSERPLTPKTEVSAELNRHLENRWSIELTATSWRLFKVEFAPLFCDTYEHQSALAA